MGVFGGLRRDEMVKMTVDDIEDRGAVLLIKVPETKTFTSKSFTIVEESEIGTLNLVKKYIALRPKGCKQRRFFLTYRNNKCIELPVGKNTIGSVPSIIAKYLNLENPKGYTDIVYRRRQRFLFKVVLPLKH
ncbi:hypothetical protein JTB14_018541 [Gonioctena quinquepunctata]|nr:hypothetical protein JTB14_018541 [Gonioctena quinquepunctata]